jgi:BirA family biotin operon repressor/biotin-[acetyl-CoA-carboxylase] ligase
MMYKDKILKLLKSTKSGFVSGEELAMKLGVSRTMVWKHMKALEREGFGIEAVPSQGYRITLLPDLLRKAEIKQGLKTRAMGRKVHLYSETASTNSLAMEMASKGAPEGTALIAETQTAGRGRLGRKWISPKGNLYFSVVLRPNTPTHKAPLITLMGAVAVAAAIRKTCGVQAVIKWPNDILVSGKKVSGLLTEMSAEPDRIRHIALGIGVNVNMALDELPLDVRECATTLAAAAGKRIDRTVLLQQILRNLESRYQVLLTSEPDLLKEWEALNTTVGKKVAVRGLSETLVGLAQGINSEGRLVLRLDDGSVRQVAAGDVTILKGRQSEN